jgi:F0F1-type ATP synthase membrane subunit b/b'
MIMGFLDTIKKALSGGKTKADDAKVAAAKGKTKVNEAAEKTETKVNEAVDKSKRAADKADKEVDDVSDDLK